MGFEPVVVRAKCIAVDQFDGARRAAILTDGGCEVVLHVQEGTVAYEAVACVGREVYLSLTPESPEWADALKPLAEATI